MTIDKDRIFAVLVQLSRHTVPIMKRSADGSTNLAGSGVYCEYRGYQLLVTAAHVIDRSNPANLLVSYSTSTIANIQYSHMLVVDDDRIDLGIFVLKEPLEPFVMLSPDSFQYGPIENSNIVLAGFPCSRSKIRFGRAETEQRFIVTTIVDPGKSGFKNVDERYNYVCDFRKEQLRDLNDSHHTFPDPYGMSGGGMWCLTETDPSAPLCYQLTGILTDWNSHTRRFIKCTNIRMASIMINERLLSDSKGSNN